MNLPSPPNTEDLGLEPGPRNHACSLPRCYPLLQIAAAGFWGNPTPQGLSADLPVIGKSPLSPLIAPWNGGKARFLGRVTEKPQPLSVETQRMQSSAQHKEGWRVLSTLCMPDPCLYYLI